MKRFLTATITVLMVLLSAFSAFAEGNVTYSEDARKFIFAPGSEYSVTDLFTDFKDVMPGDSISQKITVKNDEKNEVKVRIYMRSLGAHEDSEAFLSQLNLRVNQLEKTELFDATADESAQLTDWVYLGTLYSGGQTDLEVILDVPVTLTNEYSKQIGYLDWEFKVEELPVESTDPKPPETGDHSNMIFWVICLAASAVVIIVLLVGKRRKEKEDESN